MTMTCTPMDANDVVSTITDDNYTHIKTRLNRQYKREKKYNTLVVVIFVIFVIIFIIMITIGIDGVLTGAFTRRIQSVIAWIMGFF